MWLDRFVRWPPQTQCLDLQGMVCMQDVQSKKGKSGPQIIGYGTSRDPLKLACRMLIRTTSTVDAWWKNLQEVALPRNTFSLKIIFSFEPRITHDSIQYYTDYSEERCLWRLQRCRRGEQCHSGFHEPAIFVHVFVSTLDLYRTAALRNSNG